MNGLKIPKGKWEAVNKRKTDTTMTKRKTIHIKLKIEQHEPEGCHDSSSIEYTSGKFKYPFNLFYC